MIRRWLRRRRLLREAARLEREAALARRTNLDRWGVSVGRTQALGALAVATAMRFAEHPGVSAAGEAMVDHLFEREERRAAELAARAKALREEAGR